MTAAIGTKENVATPQVRDKWRKRGLQTFLAITAFVWLIPLLWAFYTSLRPYSETAERGYVSIGGAYNFDNYTQAWTDTEMLGYFVNTMWITIPSVILILFLALATGCDEAPAATTATVRRTGDIANHGETPVGTEAMGDLVAKALS